MSRSKKSRAPKTDKPSFTVAEMSTFLDRRVGRRNYVRDAVENVWIVADKSHSGEGRGFHVVTRDGLRRRVVIEPMALNWMPAAKAPAPRVIAVMPADVPGLISAMALPNFQTRHPLAFGFLSWAARASTRTG